MIARPVLQADPRLLEFIDRSVVPALLKRFLELGRVFEAVKDGHWRTLQEIAAAAGDPQASVSAQLRHLRKPRFGGYVVEKRRRGVGGTWQYRLRLDGDVRGAARQHPPVRTRTSVNLRIPEDDLARIAGSAGARRR